MPLIQFGNGRTKNGRHSLGYNVIKRRVQPRLTTTESRRPFVMAQRPAFVGLPSTGPAEGPEFF